MNRGQINGFALNGASADPVVRVRVDAKGYARVRARGRVLTYSVIHAAPIARLGGVLGRVEAHLSAQSLARAAVEGALGRVDIHSLLAVTGRVVIDVTLAVLRGRVSVNGRAVIGTTPHTLARGGAAAVGQAKLAPKTMLLRRGPVLSQARAGVEANGVVYARRWLRSPAEGKAQAFIVSAAHIEARLAALVRAKANAAADCHVLVRAPMGWQGVAFIEIDPSIHKRLPFDEPAPESRTFYVPTGMTIFYVTDQGTSMFRTAPMQPADTQDFDIEFSEWFPPGDEIVAVVLKVLPAMPMPPSYAIEGQRVKVWVYAGGTSGQKYQISVTATTNDGRAKEVELIVPIKEV